MRKHRLIFIVLLYLPLPVICNTWKEASHEKEAKLNVYWFTSTPFIYRDSDQKLVGIEHDLLILFTEYLKNVHEVDLELNWIKSTSFFDVLELIRNTNHPGDLGVSAFSITEEREQFLKFTDPYLPDVTVLVTGRGTPIVESYDQFYNLVRTMEAITIRGTVYEDLLRDLQDEMDIFFDVHYISSDENILEYIAADTRRFGFIDLPIYLMSVKRGGELTRQNIFTTMGTGYGLIMSPLSDWEEPFNMFLQHPEYEQKIAKILASYLGEELYLFLNDVATHEELGASILTKEKEMQLALIKNANLKLEQNRVIHFFLLVGICIATILLLLIGVLFFINRRNTNLLIAQNSQIESQQEAIRHKNEQLLNRNMQLVGLNEEKNNLMRIFAHDIRSPLSQIIGLSGYLNTHMAEISTDDHELIAQIGISAGRMNDMINKILDVDAIETNKSMVLKEKVDVLQIVQDISGLYQPLAAEKKIQFKLQCEEQSCAIFTDHMLLFLILENLVSNAVKFSPPGSCVLLAVLLEAEEVQFLVKDQGPGFTESDQQHLFGRFQKLSAHPTGNEASVGLGLFIVKKYVTDLGGTLRLRETSPQGSSFVVSLPR